MTVQETRPARRQGHRTQQPRWIPKEKARTAGPGFDSCALRIWRQSCVFPERTECDHCSPWSDPRPRLVCPSPRTVPRPKSRAPGKPRCPPFPPCTPVPLLTACPPPSLCGFGNRNQLQPGPTSFRWVSSGPRGKGKPPSLRWGEAGPPSLPRKRRCRARGWKVWFLLRLVGHSPQAKPLTSPSSVPSPEKQPG